MDVAVTVPVDARFTEPPKINSTVGFAVKLLPTIVRGMPPSGRPVFGVMEVNVGSAALL